MQSFDGSSLGSCLPPHEAKAVKKLIDHIAAADGNYFASVRVEIGGRSALVSRLGPTYRSLVVTLQAAVITQLPESAVDWQLPDADNGSAALADLVVAAITDVRDDHLTDIAEEAVPECSSAARSVLSAVNTRVRETSDVDLLYIVAESAAHELLDAIELYLLASVLGD